MEIQHRKVRITRRTSQYNKYIKWFAETYNSGDILISSFGYRTRKEAEHSLRDGQTFHIGNRTIKTENTWI